MSVHAFCIPLSAAGHLTYAAGRPVSCAPCRRPMHMTACPAPRAVLAADVVSKKAALVSKVADLDLGRAVLDDKAAQEEVDEMIRELEAENPTENPADDPLRRARWRLLYTTSPIVLGRGRPGFSSPQTCWQTIDMEDGADEGRLRNEEEGVLQILGLKWKWRNQINGKLRSLRGNRLRLKFEKFTIGNLISVPFPGPVVAWQDQTYLDEQLRIARTNFGNVFVLERDGEPWSPLV